MIAQDGCIISPEKLREAVTLVSNNRHISLKRLASALGCAITTAHRYRSAALAAVRPAPTDPANPADLARADRLLSPDELRQKYSTDRDAGEHPQHLRWMWREAVIDDKTLRGYWDWCATQIEEEE